MHGSISSFLGGELTHYKGYIYPLTSDSIDVSLFYHTSLKVAGLEGFEPPLFALFRGINTFRSQCV